MKSPLESFSKFLYIESREIYGVPVSPLAHCDLLSFVDDFRVGSAIVLGNIWRGSRREYKEFKVQTFFFNK
jgi:hypothetical protein